MVVVGGLEPPTSALWMLRS